MSEQTLSFPGFVDVHVHFRDPGMPAAETTATGLAAAKRGGFAAVVTMPNTTPAGDSVAWIKRQMEGSSWSSSSRKDVEVLAKPRSSGEARTPPLRRCGVSPHHDGVFSSASIDDSTLQPQLSTSTLPRIFPSACITKGRLGKEVADLETLAEAGAAFFTDDGSYVADDAVMEQAMERIAALNMVVCQHAMDPSEQKGGVIRDCALARKLNLPVISVETETKAIRRDLSLCRETGCRLHVQHISTAEGVSLVRAAQREGLPVTAEATPHHLLLSCDDLVADDANFKMAPPLGNHEDRAELRKAMKDGVLMFATDHAPHPAATKAKGFAGSANGIIGLETAIPITYAVMVEEEGMPVEAWVRAWTEMPYGILSKFGGFDPAALLQTTVVIGETRKVDLSSFASLSRNCPYDGRGFRCWPT